jgi:hypothetical protein
VQIVALRIFRVWFGEALLAVGAGYLPKPVRDRRLDCWCTERCATRMRETSHSRVRPVKQLAVARIDGVGGAVMEAIGADPVRDEVPLWQRHELNLEVVPDAVDGASLAPCADRHFQREELARRGAGSRSAGCA